MSSRKEDIRHLLGAGGAANDQDEKAAPNTVINYYYGPETVNVSGDKPCKDSDPIARNRLDPPKLLPNKPLRGTLAKIPLIKRWR